MSQDQDRRGRPASLKEDTSLLSEEPDDQRSQHETDASITPKNLAHLGSPFAHTAAPADLIDLWDETERFFDALGDPHDFIEPEGTPTFSNDDSPIISSEEDDSFLEIEASQEFVDPFLIRESEPLTFQKDRIISSRSDAKSKAAQRSESKHERVNTPVVDRVKPRFKSKSISPSTDGDQSAQITRVTLAERFDQRHSEHSRIIVIAGGKGGVGRSLITANLALSLAKLSREKVVVADFDPLGGNLHTYLGLDPLLSAPGHYLRQHLQSIAEQIPQSSVVLVRSARPICEPLNMQDRDIFLQEALNLQPKWLIVDAGMLPDHFTLELFVNADYSLITYTPDPSSVERGHAFLQAALYRQLIAWGDDTSAIARSLLSADHENQLTSPDTLARALRHIHPEASQKLTDRINRFCPQVIVNQCRTRSDQVSGEEICSVLRRKWRIQPRFLGSVSHHHVAHQSLVERRPLTVAYPSAAPSLDIERIARSLIRERAHLETVPKELVTQTHSSWGTYHG
jgi:flagellar biosynthesis protein FlhG